jgi:hypothetical protein
VGDAVGVCEGLAVDVVEGVEVFVADHGLAVVDLALLQQVAPELVGAFGLEVLAVVLVEVAGSERPAYVIS